MSTSFETLGKRLTSAVNAYNETIGTVETRVMVSARRFRDLQVSEGELSPLQPIEAPVRQVQTPELLGRPVPDVAELVQADAELLWSDDEVRKQA
jgi:DNA recombination protein RmuC